MRWRITAPQVDRVLAVVFSAVWLVQVVVAGDQLHPDRWSMGLCGLVVCGSMWFRRAHPLVVGLVVEAIMEGTSTWGSLLAGPVTLGWWCALYALAAWTSDRAFVGGMVGFLVVDLTPDLLHDGDIGSGNGSYTAAALVIMLLVRIVVGGRDRQLRLAQRERDVAAREAVVEERERIARELHDVIAHHVSTMVIQAGAERRTLGDEQAETREVLGTIERVGRGALAEMRRMVAMLRQDPEDDLVPQPRLGDVPELVRQMQASGLAVTLDTAGEPRPLPEGIELSAYRIVQEALTNALKHAHGAQASVQVRYGDDVLELGVYDDGHGTAASVDGSGHGLAGMRERVAMYGGTIETGPRARGGFGVRVRLPAR